MIVVSSSAVRPQNSSSTSAFVPVTVALGTSVGCALVPGGLSSGAAPSALYVTTETGGCRIFWNLTTSNDVGRQLPVTLRVSVPGSSAYVDAGFLAEVASSKPPSPSPAPDTTPPSFNVSDITVELGTSLVGVYVEIPRPNVTDDTDPSPSVTCSPSSGTYPLWYTVVSCTATDASGNAASRSFLVKVECTPAPAGFYVLLGYDHKDDDMTRNEVDIPSLAAYCLSVPYCRGFNQGGWVKSSVADPQVSVSMCLAVPAAARARAGACPRACPRTSTRAGACTRAQPAPAAAGTEPVHVQAAGPEGANALTDVLPGPAGDRVPASPSATPRRMGSRAGTVDTGALSGPVPGDRGRAAASLHRDARMPTPEQEQLGRQALSFSPSDGRYALGYDLRSRRVGPGCYQLQLQLTTCPGVTHAAYLNVTQAWVLRVGLPSLAAMAPLRAFRGAPALLVAAAALLLASWASAAHFRGSTLTYRIDNNDQLELTLISSWAPYGFTGFLYYSSFCNIIIEHDQRWDYKLNRGVSADQNFTLLKDASGSYYTTFRKVKAFPEPSVTCNFTSLQCEYCRAQSLVAGAEGQVSLSTVYDPSVPQSPAPTSPAILQVPLSNTSDAASAFVPVSSAPGAKISCSLVPGDLAEVPSELSVQTQTGGCRVLWYNQGRSSGNQIPVSLRVSVPGTQAYVDTDFLLEIADVSVGGPPVTNATFEGQELQQGATLTFNPGTSYTVTFTSSDPDQGAVLTAQTLTLPDGASLTGTPGPSPITSTFTWTPSASDAGQSGTFQLIVTDDTNLQTTASFGYVVPRGNAGNPPSTAAKASTSQSPAAADHTAPVFTSKALDINAEVGTSYDGVYVNVPTPNVRDDTDPRTSVSCNPTSGTFPLGYTTVICTASDAAGNAASQSFTVTVSCTPAPAGFDVQLHMDHWGSDIAHMQGDVPAIAAACLADPSCRGFNQGGWIKYTLAPTRPAKGICLYERNR
ncbi:hypothetical protein HYH03_001752 [Edaphochlamys debaryana]|uniref:HYR domain-containing protein n=1 Tax=Edaphochlamys debaryana TaxID=47281 RepID=A0A836C4S9_9CHLO|nr:hypothetical protein HYH03_001752 [Edaphochlamys debaryana]|eukprot:KAG2500170.1 hypothetical protein HYH03_001752 [Edaphochlamys debaryana]